jgi:stearoyl-CoA desaturase (delta-9 desaturase)
VSKIDSPPSARNSGLNHATSNALLQRPANLLQRISTLIAILLPFAALIYCLIRFWKIGVDWPEITMLFVMYLATGFGITIGYHRLFAHRAFKTYAPVRAILAILGAMAVQGPLIRWVAVHRCHHQHSDHQEDPHSPHTSGRGIRGFFKGLAHSHIGWMFTDDNPGLARYVRDLQADKVLCGISRRWLFWVFMGLLIPTVLCGAISGTWTGALLGLLWGGLVRIFLIHHVTWSINSVCHIWGQKTYDTFDHSRNNLIFGIIGLGEGWHNNHHAFPHSARHGLAWWQIDFSFIIIRVMQNLGLVWSVRTAGVKAMQAKRTDRSNKLDY